MKYYLISLLSIFLLTSCHSVTKVDSTAAYQSFDVQCLGVEGDGTQTVRSWGKGKNKADAIEQAKKNAVYAVVFKGITSGTGDCNKRPLMTGPNDREKYETYFDRFFADGGEYRNFATNEDENRTSRMKADGGAIEGWSVVVRVKRAELRQQLIQDGLIKN